MGCFVGRISNIILRFRLLAVFAGCAPVAMAQQAPISYDGTVVPPALQGPFVSDPEVIALLDKVDPRGCEYSGPLVFGCLIQANAKNPQHFGDSISNPFSLDIARIIVDTIKGDLGVETNGDGTPQPLPENFLTSPASRVQLVGIVNRMDRQFVREQIPGHAGHDGCGEISVIYRFAYLRPDGAVGSRLPVTMNVVFPAVPTSKPPGMGSCAEVAQRWLDEIQQPPGRSGSAIAAGLQDPATGVLAGIVGQDIFRIELNMQAYRIAASADRTGGEPGKLQYGLGSTAKYIIRVFRWDPKLGLFFVSHLNNQIDRSRLLGSATGDENSCTRDPYILDRGEFLAWLTDPKVLDDIDRGTLTVPLKYLACRAVSGSPGGQYRSLNQPFWEARTDAEQIVSDDEIKQALQDYLAQSPNPFSFMKSVDDVRTRLNDLTCSGCHQTRAIAGFHFPGADPADTPSFNAVLLPGSPHFYGDQPRRMEILEAFAAEGSATYRQLANSYAARPLNRFAGDLEHTNLIGGWGATCLANWSAIGTQRQWGCAPELQCKPLFSSAGAPSVGTCVPKSGQFQIGDAMQVGRIESAGFGVDRYTRMPEVKAGMTLLDPPSVPVGKVNPYYVAHQEWYQGKTVAATSWATAATLRDARTGGFPGGMLRYSECVGLPDEATCGLTAVTGFNDCIGDPASKITDCFVRYTAYAGLRACDAATPCRDDYICLRPIGYTASNGVAKFKEREKAIPGDPPQFAYGEQQPDFAWLNRDGGKGDQRGYCMPPYFVLQFRLDGHPNLPAP
ncbi:hypothetical protein VW23_007215 [Devosia insulae DS-56]|uniref:Cytochrome c domain-containing protein n=1 Tax=Devosia insulae DS-56 TaxID=1116389 RepID=A0A1E5XH40_9HYPH|nr:hypothetical protein VW23_007215 [Devosia insulae DS-56]